MIHSRSVGNFVALVACLMPAVLAGEKATLGDVHFPTSCRADVQARFAVAVALLHSFEFKEAEHAFEQVEREDPKCVIAAWGVALSQTERSGASAPQKNLASGWTQLQPWLSVKAGTDREQRYVDAVGAMYEGYDKTPGTQRWQRYLGRMQGIRQKYPDDVNASLFYGLGLVWTAGPGAEGLAQRREALAIFLPILSEYPNNPGAAHYIIHAADTAELAAEALPAAREYAAIAPASPHALHMPSHIFNRLGYWKESISTNQASARVAAEWIKNGRDGLSDEFHALNNLEYGYLQLGQDAQARRIIEQINTLAASRAGDSWAPIDARIYYDLETHDWPDALKVEPPAGSPFEENFDAYWIRAIAAARSGKPREAELALEDFRKSSDQFIKGHGWADILHVALVEAEAWTVYAQGQHEKAVELLTSIREFERDHPMYYADVLPRPTPEMLGDMLLQYGRSAEALTAYKEALDLAPNRLDSLLGGETSAARSGNAQLSADYASKVNAEGATPVFRP